MPASPISTKKPHFFSKLAGAITGVVTAFVRPVFSIPYGFFSNLAENLLAIAYCKSISQALFVIVASIPFAVLGAVYNTLRTAVRLPLTVVASAVIGWKDGFIAAVKLPYLGYLSRRLNSLAYEDMFKRLILIDAGLADPQADHSEKTISPRTTAILDFLLVNYPHSFCSVEDINLFFLMSVPLIAISDSGIKCWKKAIAERMEFLKIPDRLANAEVLQNTDRLSDEEFDKIKSFLEKTNKNDVAQLNKMFDQYVEISRLSKPITFENINGKVTVYESEKGVIEAAEGVSLDFKGTFYIGLTYHFTELIKEIRALFNQVTQVPSSPSQPVVDQAPRLTANPNSLYGRSSNPSEVDRSPSHRPSPSPSH